MPSIVNYKPLYRESIVYPAIEKWIIEHQMTIKDFSKLIDVSYTHTIVVQLSRQKFKLFIMN